MKPWGRLSLVLLFVLVESGSGKTTEAEQPLSAAIARTPAAVSISIVKTERVMDGGSVLNELRFSDDRIYRLSLDYPFDLATNKVIHTDIHFTIYVPGAWERRETIEHGGAAERRLIELLDQLARTTKDPREKKNAGTIIKFLKNRRQGFPMGRKWWDFSPWTLEKSKAPET